MEARVRANAECRRNGSPGSRFNQSVRRLSPLNLGTKPLTQGTMPKRRSAIRLAQSREALADASGDVRAPAGYLQTARRTPVAGDAQRSACRHPFVSVPVAWHELAINWRHRPSHTSGTRLL